jgi:hypothetical protein
MRSNFLFPTRLHVLVLLYMGTLMSSFIRGLASPQDVSSTHGYSVLCVSSCLNLQACNHHNDLCLVGYECITIPLLSYISLYYSIWFTGPKVVLILHDNSLILISSLYLLYLYPNIPLPRRKDLLYFYKEDFLGLSVGSPPNTSTSARVCRVPVYS